MVPSVTSVAAVSASVIADALELKLVTAVLPSADMVAEALTDDMNIQVQSDHGAIPAKVRTDDTLRDGVISISQGFGGLPGQAQYEDQGSNTNLLISSDRDRATINAMPRMSGIPVNISRL